MENLLDKRHLLVFSKVAKQGQVKSRIAVTNSTAEALRIYQELCHVTASVVAATKGLCRPVVHFTGGLEPDSLKTVFSSVCEFVVQQGKTLGDRLAFAAKCSFEKGASMVCIIGCDCPTLVSGDIETAFDLLADNRDVVIGPAIDGGYYLIALRPSGLEVFDAKSWGEKTLLDETMSIINNKKLSVAILSIKSDIDTWDDYQLWKG